MLRVTLEIVPFGQEERKRTIGTMLISNIGGTSKWGKYKVDIDTGNVSTTGWIHKYNRSNGAWKLVEKALKLFAF